MVYEDEVTVEIETGLEEFKEYLKKLNFKIEEEYYINDIYMIKKDYEIKGNYLEALKNCVLIRSIVDSNGEKNLITYKSKEYNEKNEIIKQGKTDCRVYNVMDAQKLLQDIGYKELIRICDKITVCSNGNDEFALQEVNDKHVYIEIEAKCNYINKVYSGIDEMKDVIKKYNIKIKGDNYFAKKAENELIEKYGKKGV